jgi:predicted HTH transcriptional regulator
LSDTEVLLFAAIKCNPYVRTFELLRNMGISEPTINRALKSLKDKGYITRIGAKKNGYWQVNDIEKK